METQDSQSAATSRPVAWSDVRLFQPPSEAGPSRIPPPPEIDPKPTPAELKRAFASHIEQRHGPDAPLMTKAMRDREEARLGLKKKEYNESRVRIKFSDRTQLEATIPASAKVPTLYAFLRAHLDEEYTQTAFTLYQTPPKRDYPEHTKDVKLSGKTLKELGMTPQAAFNIRWTKAEMNANTFAAPLSSDVRAKAERLPSPPIFDGTQEAASATGAVDAAEGQSKTQGEPKKVGRTKTDINFTVIFSCADERIYQYDLR